MGDTGGVSQDEANIQKIVETVRHEGFVNALLLVVNEECPRFDDGMQNAVKLVVDSFGENSVHRLGILYESHGQEIPKAGPEEGPRDWRIDRRSIGICHARAPMLAG